MVCPGRHWMAEQSRVSFTAFWIESGSGRGWCPLSPVAVVWPWLRSPRSYTTHFILTVKEAANPQLTSLATAAAPSAGEPLQKKQMRIIFFMDGEYLDQHNYQIKTFIFQSHNNTNRPLHSKDFVYLSDIIKLLNNKEMNEPRTKNQNLESWSYLYKSSLWLQKYEVDWCCNIVPIWYDMITLTTVWL